MTEMKKGGHMDSRSIETAFRLNARLARVLWGKPSRLAMQSLKALIVAYSVSVAAGDIQLVDGRWYVTHAGLLRIAKRNHCCGMRTAVDKGLSDPVSNRWVFKATVYKSPRSRGFVGYGDADPSNVSPLVRGAEMRVAETRAVNRALRKAYGIGLCSVEELGWSPRPSGAAPSNQNPPPANGNNGHQNSQPRLRDRLCLLVRKHQLDSTLVMRYAADFCGTEVLRDAGRDLVESFINNLADWASKDREGLLCKLNSYSQLEEGTMKRHIPGLHECSPNPDSTLEGLFLVRVERAFYRWHAHKPFFTLRFAVIEPAQFIGQHHHRTNLLFAESPLEVELVPAGLWL